ncbi:MAG: hypothetical protein ACO2PN_15170 [Pyrobaculum sp.]
MERGGRPETALLFKAWADLVERKWSVGGGSQALDLRRSGW